MDMGGEKELGLSDKEAVSMPYRGKSPSGARPRNRVSRPPDVLIRPTAQCLESKSKERQTGGRWPVSPNLQRAATDCMGCRGGPDSDRLPAGLRSMRAATSGGGSERVGIEFDRSAAHGFLIELGNRPSPGPLGEPVPQAGLVE